MYGKVAIKALATVAFVVMAFASAGANSAVITTAFESNNGQNGNMFDVVTLGGALKVTAFDLNLDPGTFTINVYKKSGSWVGYDTDSVPWVLIDSGSVTSVAADEPTFFDVLDFTLDASATSALYITATSGNMRYTNGTGVGNVAVANADLQILEGAAKGYAFGTTFEPRIWNGSIYYTSAVPIPAAVWLMGSGLLGLAGVARARRKAV